MDQVFADPQVRHLQAAADVEHPKLGRFQVVNQAIRLSRTPATVAAATPELGEHTDEILAEAGYSASDIRGMRERKVV
jgi:crotonobetainyl-CoA:carnitine CoA-transferase CaiB-like acyl-CoA transferase